MAYTTTAPHARKRTALRVLVLDQGPGLWGAQQYLLRLRPLLATDGVDLTLACPPELEQYEHWRSHDLPVIPLALPVSRSIRDESRISATRFATELGRSLAVPRLIARAAIRGGYDLVLANSHWTHVDAAVAARIWRVPTVLTLHETSVPGLGRRLRDLAVAAAGHTIAVSESVADTVGAGVRGRVSVIPNGVDTSVFTPPDDEARREVRRELGITESQRVALAATRIDPSKHIEDLVDLAAACDESVTVLVAGTTSGHGDYERRVRERAAALPPGRIRFLGARDDIPRLLGAADLYLHTGLIEGMPLGVIEAQSAGVPVAAYEAAGVRESLRDGETGYVVAPGDVDGLVRAARRVFGSAHLRRELGAAARTHVLHRHRLDAQASANAQVLRAVCRPATRARVGAP